MRFRVGSVHFCRLSRGTHTGWLIYPSLCTELICSVLALIMYSEWERRGSPLSGYRALPQLSTSFAFFLVLFLNEFHITLSVAFVSVFSVSVFFNYTRFLSRFNLVSCCSQCPATSEILCHCTSPVMRKRLFSFMSVLLASSCLVKQMDPLANGALVRIHCKHCRLEATLTHSLP